MAAYLDDVEIEKTLGRDIAWESFASARLISDKDVQLIRRYDKRSPELRASMLDEAGPAYVEAFLSVLKAVSKEDTVQYVLALLLQMLQENPARAKFFHLQSEQHMATLPDPYTPFLRLLQRQDWFTQEKSAKLLTAVIEGRPRKSSAFSNGVLAADAGASATAAYGGPDPAEPHVSGFIDWLIGQLRRPSNPTKSVPLSTGLLSVLLKERGSRQLFLRAGGTTLLPSLLKSSNSPSNSQLLYELCMCVWQMTFVPAACDALSTAGVTKPLVEVCRGAQKEKVFRIALSALRNLLDADTEHNGAASDMVEAGLPKIVITRQLQSWGDEDVPEQLAYMDEKLRQGIQVLSNFDKYRKEVTSGQLDWSPMHTSDVFWRENVEKFEERDFVVLRALLKLLETSREVKTLAVGCHDLGMFIVHHPQGRYIVSDLRGKELVMRLMAHPDPEVQKQALLCVQKIMLRNAANN
uniref:V-type proton ATPase subunit H n=1 Tax=Chlamydomonas leiostraca TaxID=1034604 RepID=A0A7S0S4X7_9CHLO|mmetsp:Transcript_8419/g.21016  ORF Transcript_8419/g.21016 Transcript_8419/m.21016 type:complete len:466 (+) Transcript_8419:95-1492(+)|eukprot:CAMPEP_0202865304 /NCGR_PEP_ID=MMETSP1391-20130828/5615_1 /ASSEMBLY_ACC=CAM_ASM_000867 /TAXON_ID=1034604 /ORGANISM="Chlamydomonas leiostraca, Strain SAG 11-49" /LENGTH=465 /DNA_ID=CAMNT_0049545127 /DNA_START=91 /DNA_END=1488 /DNA_ORIENTATION=+